MIDKVYTIIPENGEGDYIGDYTYENVTRPSYCYLHGELKKLAGYDIFSMLKSELEPEQIQELWLSDKFEEGIYPCICMGKQCTFFRWKTNTSHKSYTGLVVLDEDFNAWQYAFGCYVNKVDNI